MSIDKNLEKLIQQQDGGLTLSLSNGFKIWVTRFENYKHFTLAVSHKEDDDTRIYKEVGTITDIDLFRRCFNG